MARKHIEALLLSSIVNAGSITDALAHNIKAEHFKLYRQEWEWLLHRSTQEKSVPRPDVLSNKFDDFPYDHKASDVAHYCLEFVDTYKKRSVVEVARDLGDNAYAGDVGSAANEATIRLANIAREGTKAINTNVFDDDKDIQDDLRRRFNRREKDGHAGIMTGFESVDTNSGGFQPGALSIVAARLGVGKSWILQKCAAEAVKGGHVVQFVALEQTRSEVMYRMVPLLSHIYGIACPTTSEMMFGHIHPASNYAAARDKIARRTDAKLFVSDASAGPVGVASLTSMLEYSKPDVMFVDYLTLLQGAGDWQSIGNVSGELKRLAVRYDIPIIAAAQLNRTHGLGKDPAGSEALFGADKIGHDADLLITATKGTERIMRAKIAKNRNGRDNVDFHIQFEPGKGVVDHISDADALVVMEQDEGTDEEVELGVRKDKRAVA